MKMTSQGSSDELDLLIARQVRTQRPLTLVRPLPAAQADEPSDDELLMAVEGRLEAGAAQALDRKLESHPFSRDRLEILREALEESRSQRPEDGASAELERPQRDTPLARLVFAFRRGGGQVVDFIRGSEQPVVLGPSALATRGGEVGSHAAQAAGSPHPGADEPFYKFARRFGSCDAMIYVERVPGRGVDLRLELSASGEPVTDGRASLRRQGRLVESIRIRRGQADFRGLEPAASYEMEIKWEGELVGEVCLSFLPV